MKIASIVGTRPNFIKEYAMRNELKTHSDINWTLIHTGQHYSYELSQTFFDSLNLPQPDKYLDVGSGSLCYQRGETIVRLEKILKKISPDLVIVYGDVNATLAGAIAARSLNIKLAHIEAGVRGYNLSNQEEVNRITSDVLADINFCVLKEHQDNLLKENHHENSVFISGDLHYDVFLEIKNKTGLKREPKNYILVTIHRHENQHNPDALKEIVEALLTIKTPIKWPVHPGTYSKLEEYSLLPDLKKASHIDLLPPLNYIHFTRLLKDAKFVLTDSGGVRREAYFWQIPSLILIDLNWFKEIETLGWKRTVGPDKRKIISALNSFEIPNKHPKIFGDGNAAKKIFRIIKEYL